MSVLNHSLLLGADAGAAGYQIQRSLRFNSSDSAYLSRTPASAGNRRTFTWAGWVKRSTLGTYQWLMGGGANGSNTDDMYFGTDDTLTFSSYYAGTQFQLTLTRKFRDVSAWYHIVFVADTTQTTDSNRIKIYINGEQQTAFNTSAYPALNFQFSYFNNTSQHLISSSRFGTPGNYLDGYLADVHFIDGQALTPSSFTETDANGVLQPKAYSGSYGTQGWKLSFSDNSTAAALGTDTSGNGNTWTVNNLSVTAGAGNDSLVDSPTNYGTGNSGGDVRGNFCTWNPLSRAGGATYSQGNLEYVGTLGGVDTPRTNATISVSTGKWYYEVTLLTAPASPRNSGSVNNSFGWGLPSVFNKNSAPNTSAMDDAVFMGDSGWYKNFTGSNTDSGYGFASGDVLGVAVDLDANTFAFYKNGTSIVTGTIGGTAGRELTPTCASYSGTYGAMAANFGQRPFAYTAPSGFKALCTQNLPQPTGVVAQPSTAMDVKLYTGNGSSQTISGLGFSPDLVWIKSRSNNYGHWLTDSVRGVNKQLQSNSTNAEQSYDMLTAFNSNGFSLGTDDAVNGNTYTFVAWNWDAGSSTVTNTQGSITSSVRANASAGFSVVGWTGSSSSATIGHGLGVAPSMIIVKCRSSGGTGWPVYHQSLGGVDKVITLQSTGAVQTISNYWNTTAPSSTTFGVASGYDNNVNGATMIAYCFAPVAGYSSFGSYTGNGSSDGPFVYCGFRPRWILRKKSSSSSYNASWSLYDTSRIGYNKNNYKLYPDSSTTEDSSSQDLDILSNGFKIRVGDVYENENGATYIYAAFAESPFAYARAR